MVLISKSLLLKAFFCRAGQAETTLFAKSIYDKIEEMNNHILQIIVDNLAGYKETAIENLFIQLYMNDSLCKKETREIVRKYLYT